MQLSCSRCRRGSEFPHGRELGNFGSKHSQGRGKLLRRRREECWSCPRKHEVGSGKAHWEAGSAWKSGSGSTKRVPEIEPEAESNRRSRVSRSGWSEDPSA